MIKFIRNLFGRSDAVGDPREMFLALVERMLERMPQVTRIKRVPNDFALEAKVGEGEHKLFLGNIYDETRELSPEERSKRVTFFLASLLDAGDTEDTWVASRGSVVPVLRATTYGIEIWMSKPDARNVRRPFLPFLDTFVVVDRPTAMSYITRAKAAGWNTDEGAIFAAADARLADLADPRMELHDELHGPLWVVATNDTYEASRLLVPGWLASFRGKVEGRPIAIVPERSMLMVGGDARPEMIARLLDKAEREFSASNRRISPALYTVNDGGEVVPYARPKGDPLASKVAVSHEKLAMHEYENQKAVLEKVYPQNGPDVFVASYKVFGRDDGTVRSVGVWTEGVPTYLPRTERVLLVMLGEGGTSRTTDVPFEAVEARLTRVPDLVPPRFATGEFPPESERNASIRSQ